MQMNIQAEINTATAGLEDEAKQVQFALNNAIGRTAYAAGLRMQKEMTASFEAPTPYAVGFNIAGGGLYSKGSKISEVRAGGEMYAEFGMVDNALLKKSGGGSPADILGHHFYGGISQHARFEYMFRRIDMLRANEDIVPPLGEKLSNAIIVKMLSYFQAFYMAGYSANSTPKTRAKMAKITRKEFKGKKYSRYVTINGVVYFYANGSDHLHRGIWAKTGIHGSDIKPVMMFVRRAIYKKRFDLKTMAEQARQDFPNHFATELKKARSTAR